jgi:hypothetical protein
MWGCLCVSLFGETNSSEVVDGGGLPVSNAFFSGVCAVGQGGPVGLNAGGGFRNQSGFLQTFVWHPAIDTDGDGIVDENDPDDDNDTLTDMSELYGTNFNPTTSTDPLSSDSDGDGKVDGFESQEGSNPLDPGSVFQIFRITVSNGMDIVAWRSQGGRTYEVLRTTNIHELLTGSETAEVVTAVGGVGPFLDTTSVSTNPAGPDRMYYTIKLQP